MDKSSLEITNPWWQDRTAIDRDQHLIEIVGRPYYFDNPLKMQISLQLPGTYILRGARQVGKTTLIKEKFREGMVLANIKPSCCLYVSCETYADFHTLQEALTPWLQAHQDERLLIGLDEITFVKEWQRTLLWWFNTGLLKSATVIITGSNARDLRVNAERFPGRPIQELSIPPLSCHDYAAVPCMKTGGGQARLDCYLKVGGFPHAIRDFSQHGFVTDETYETYANWIFGDAHQFQLTRETLVHILFRIFDTVSSQVTWQRLLEKTPIKSHVTSSAYVEHLELSYLCQVLHCYDTDKQMASSKKSKKIYFIDPLLYALVGGYLRGIRNVYQWWVSELASREFWGNIFESVVAAHAARIAQPLYYWYSSNLKRETDLLVTHGNDLTLYDIKSQAQAVKPALGRMVTVITPQIFTSRRDFLEVHSTH